MAIFYPSLVCNLQLRFDEGVTLIPATDADTLALTGADASSSTNAPQVLASGSGADQLNTVLGIVPSMCSVELPGYRQAGTFKLTMAYSDLPLDPRAVRAIGVAIHLDGVQPGAWGDGMTGGLTAGRRSSILQTNDQNLLIAGVADSIDVEHSSSGSWINLEGRDLRGILLDQALAPNTLDKLDLSQTIDVVVQNILSKFPFGAGIQVDVRADDWGGPLPKVMDLTTAARHALNSGGKHVPPKVKGDQNRVTFWDLITLYCFQVGAIPYFVGSRLRIRPARTLFDQRLNETTFDPRFATPFKGGYPRSVNPPVTTGSEDYTYRRLVFGDDIDSLKYERKLAGVKVPVVQVVSYNPDAQKGTNPKTGLPYRVLVAEHPPDTQKPARQTSVSISGEQAQTEVVRINVPGIKSQDALQRIAQDLYEEIGRGELGGCCATKNLTSFGGSSDDPDLLRLRPGDPVEFRLNAAGLQTFPPPANVMLDNSASSQEEEIQVMTLRLGDAQAARRIVTQTRRQATAQRTFRVCNVKFDWAKDSGVGVAFDFQNYVEARYAVTPQ